MAGSASRHMQHPLMRRSLLAAMAISRASCMEARRPLHNKARGAHPLYPSRSTVPDDCVSWSAEWQDYFPCAYTADSVVANDITSNPKGWADPGDPKRVDWSGRSSFEGELQFDADGRPMNPRGRTGMKERGLLGKWGPNFAADPIVTRVNGRQLQVIVIQRRDTGEWALPGGMVDAGETVSAAVRREFEEEAGHITESTARATFRQLADELFASGETIHSGYVDDPRNTDNAWMETTAIHFHCAPALGAQLPLNAGDDAAAVRWVDVGGSEHAGLYADHKVWVDAAAARLAE